MKKVVIIGAGPAGLTMAYELLKKNDEYEVEILEESNQIGGISKTIQYNGNRMDIGGHRFFSKDEEIMKFWSEIMPIQGKPAYDDKKLNNNKEYSKDGPDPEKQNNVMLIRRRVSRIYYNKKFFKYPVTMEKQTIKNMGTLTTLKAGFSYIKASIFKRKENSLEDFYINRFGKVLYSMFFEKYTEKLWGRHPREISADWGAQRVKGMSISAILKDIFMKKIGKKNNKNTESSLIEQFWYPKYGPGELWETLADIVIKNGGKIKKQCKVNQINFADEKIISVTCEEKGKEEKIEGDIFVSTMPLNELILGFNGIDVPKQIQNIASGLPYRDFMTVGILVDKLNLKNETNMKTIGNIVPDCWIYVQDPNVKMCRLQIFNNWSPYLVKDIEKTIWIGTEYTCKEGDELWNMQDNEFEEFAINELISMNIIKKENVQDSHLERIKKAYPAYFDTYKDIDKLIEYINKIDNLYCIGRNGQHHYNNMDHSMATAKEAANNIEKNILDKSNIWQVNTDNSYHETKVKK